MTQSRFLLKYNFLKDFTVKETMRFLKMQLFTVNGKQLQLSKRTVMITNMFDLLERTKD